MNPEARKKLSQEEQREVGRITELCDQFISAEIYVLAAPMWSLSFPAPVKEYIDCVVQAERTIAFRDKKPFGLLDDKKRAFVYVQSSGGKVPWILRPALNKGLNYISDIMRFIGIGKVEELLVDGTGIKEEERLEAIEKASEGIESLAESISLYMRQ